MPLLALFASDSEIVPVGAIELDDVDETPRVDESTCLGCGVCAFHCERDVITMDPDVREVLLPLVCGRLAVTVCMATSRLSVDPGHPNWFVSLEPAIELLGRLYEVGNSAFTPG